MITLMPAVLMGLIVYYSGAFSLAELDQNKTVANLYGYFLTGFVSAWILLAFTVVLISVLAFAKVVGVTKDGFTNFAKQICCWCFSKPNEQVVYTVVSDPANPNVIDLDKQMFFAQITLDLLVILGPTMMDVGTTMQRGVVRWCCPQQ
jgi:hypothetical protein